MVDGRSEVSTSGSRSMKFMVSTGVYWEHLTEFRTGDGERCLMGKYFVAFSFADRFAWNFSVHPRDEMSRGELAPMLSFHGQVPLDS